MVALLLACVAEPDPDAVVEGRRWSSESLGLAIDFPEGWRIVVDSELFRSELQGVVLEGRFGETRLALTVHGVPPLLGRGSELDLLHLLAPAVGASADPDYRLERLPDCGGVVQRQVEGLWQWAVRVPPGLALLHAWEGEAAPARALVCEHLERL